jgi:hypothetical protein
MSLAVIVATNNVLPAKLVLRSVPFQRTFEPETNPVPLTANMKAAPPGVAAEGDIEVTVGTGLLMLNMTLADQRFPTGLYTLIQALRAAAMSAAVIEACSCVLLIKAVARGLQSPERVQYSHSYAL